MNKYAKGNRFQLNEDLKRQSQHQRAYTDGVRDRAAGKARNENPHLSTGWRAAWFRGYDAAIQEAK